MLSCEKKYYPVKKLFNSLKAMQTKIPLRDFTLERTLRANTCSNS
jgi:hypothetical protein